MKTKIAVELRGGQVIDIYATTEDVEIIIIDRDLDAGEEVHGPYNPDEVTEDGQFSKFFSSDIHRQLKAIES